ncbi:MAG: DNA-processing protein DprA [Chthonomonadales bacterium]
MEQASIVHLVLLLMETPGVGPRAVASVLRRAAVLRTCPEAVMRAPPTVLAEQYGLGRKQAERFAQLAREHRTVVWDMARWLSRNGVAVVTLSDASYPQRLLGHMADPPPVLFLYGEASLLDGTLFAVANSNKAPEPMLKACDRAAEEANDAGLILVTGHNRLEYQRPALAVRRNGGSVCTVLDRGLVPGFGGDLTRPLFAAARIWSCVFDVRKELALTPFALHDYGIGANNRKRDELIFALADVIYAGFLLRGGRMEYFCTQAAARGAVVRYVADGPPRGSPGDASARASFRVPPQ